MHLQMTNPNHWERLQILGTFPQSFAGKTSSKNSFLLFTKLIFASLTII